MRKDDDLEKLQRAIDRVKLAYESLQFREPGEKLFVSYSGGKDSECIAEICIMAVGGEGIEINYNATGIDPPEVVKHIRARFARWEAQGIECHFNKPEANMHDLIVKKGPPTRIRRYCCEKLKEGAGAGRVVITGVRWAESPRRASIHDVVTIMHKNKEKRAKYHNDNDVRRQIMEQCVLKSRLTVNPIVDWSDADVWEFIKGNGIPYCSLYDEGFKRLGCIGCPMAGKTRVREFKRWPHMERFYRRAFAEFLMLHPEYKERYGWHTVDDLWHWWMEDNIVPGQVTLGDVSEGEDEKLEAS